MLFLLFFLLPLVTSTPDEFFQFTEFIRADIFDAEHAEYQLVEGAVEHFVEEPGTDLFATVQGIVDEGTAFGAMTNQALLLHVAQHRLNGVEGQFPLRTHPLVNLAYAAFPYLPQSFEDFQL